MSELGAHCQPSGECAGPVVDIGGWLRAGWLAAMDNIWALLALMVLWVWLFATISALNAHPLTLILLGPATGAAYAVVLSMMRSGRPDFNRIAMSGQTFLQLMLAGILITIFVAVGLAFLIIPGLAIAALYLFALPLIVDRKLSFWEAMEESRKAVQQDWIGFIAFVLALAGINLLGLAAMGIGVLLTGAVTWCAVAAAYETRWPAKG
jgi:uncharacterized membrane protein